MNTEFSVKRITDALAEVDRARNEASSAKAAYKAKREILAACQEALEEAIRAETSPAPLFDRPPSEVSFTAQVGQALRDGLKGTGVELIENPGQADVDVAEPAEETFPEPVLWNVYDAYRRKDAGEVEARSYSEAKRLAHGHYPEVPEGACLVTRVKAEPAPTEPYPGWGKPTSWIEFVKSEGKHCQVEWEPSLLEPGRVVIDGQAYSLEVPPDAPMLGLPGEVLGPLARAFVRPVPAPDAWRHQGVGLALRTLGVPTVKKLGQAGLATVGQLQDWFLANPGKSIYSIGSKSTAAVEDALVKYLDSRPVPGTGEGCRDGDEDAE